MPIIEVTNLGLSYKDRAILSSVSFSINEGDRIGVTGRNGEGKTTLLRLLVGELKADAGRILRASGIRIGYLAQRIPTFTGTVFSQAMAGKAEILLLKEKLRRLEILLEKSSEDAGTIKDLLEEYSRAQNRFEDLGGYDLEHETCLVLSGLGLPQKTWHEPAMNLSGGQKMRLSLARILLAEPDVLFLDEPTNHLDIAGVEWLESYLKRYKGAMLIVSHDRRFLDNLCQKMLEVESGQITLYRGNFSAYLSQKEEAIKRQEALYREQQELIARTREFIQKWKANARRTGQAKSREKMLERLEIIEKPKSPKKLKVKLRLDGSLGKEVLRVKALGKSFVNGTSKGLELFKDFSCLIQKGERVALVGPNGCGKTTFLKCLLGLESYDGEVIWGQGSSLGYFSQETSFPSEDIRILDEIMSLGLKEKEARDILGRFLFSGDDVEKRVEELSGGEKKRLNLAKLVLSGATVLLLDEPTNHLDISSREALEEAILDFSGTVIFASHDRYLIDRVATRTLFFKDGRIVDFPGNYSFFLEEEKRRLAAAFSVDEKRKGKTHDKKSEEEDSKGPNLANVSRDRQEAETKLKEVEVEILKLEAREEELSRILSDPKTYIQSPRETKDPSGLSCLDVSSLLTEYSEVKKSLEELYARWDEAARALSATGQA